MNDSYEHGPLLEWVQSVRATGCNECWCSPFIDGLHQYVWVGYKPRETTRSKIASRGGKKCGKQQPKAPKRDGKTQETAREEVK